MKLAKFVITVTSLLILTACDSTTSVESDLLPGHAILWAAHAAEYQAISLQVYAQATRDLPRLIADTSWSALPGHEGMLCFRVTDDGPGIPAEQRATLFSSGVSKRSGAATPSPRGQACVAGSGSADLILTGSKKILSAPVGRIVHPWSP